MALVSGRPLAAPGRARAAARTADLHRHAGLRRASRSISARCCCSSRCCSSSSRGSRAFPIATTAPDFYTLVLGATLGMCIMASANHLLMVFLGVEMASVPSYALAGMLKGRRQEQRGGAQVCRLRRRHRRRHALRHQPAGRRARLVPPADDGRAAGRLLLRPARSAERARWCWCSAG